jgi:methyl-accepting chemotaxis protein
MTFKSKIWLLPVLTAVIVSVGIAINSRIAASTSADLRRVEQVQYPTVEAVRAMRAEFAEVQESLQQAVSEGDDAGLQRAETHAGAYRDALRSLSDLDASSAKVAKKLGAPFDQYHRTALSAARVLMGKETDESGKHLDGIVTAVKKVAGIIGDISAASQEQTHGLDQVSQAIMEMDRMTQENSAMVEETSAVAHSMSGQAKHLTDLVAQFKIDAVAAQISNVNMPVDAATAPATDTVNTWSEAA